MFSGRALDQFGVQSCDDDAVRRSRGRLHMAIWTFAMVVFVILDFLCWRRAGH